MSEELLAAARDVRAAADTARELVAAGDVPAAAARLDEARIGLLDVLADERRAHTETASPTTNGSAASPPPRTFSAGEDLLAALLYAGSLGLDAAANTLAGARAAGVAAGAFERRREQLIYTAAAALIDADTPCSHHALTAELRRRGQLADAGGEPYLRSLAALLVVPAQANHLASLVAEAARRRELERAALAALERIRGGGDVDAIASTLAGDLTAHAAPAAKLVFTPIEQFAAVAEPGAEPLAHATAGGTIIPARGKVLVYGDGGAGKTTLVVDLCFSLAAGIPWLGLVTADRPLQVTVIENEGPRQEFRAKLERKLTRTGATVAGRIDVLEEPWAEFTFASDPQRRALAHAIDEHATDVLVVGPIVTLGMVGGGTPDEIRAFDLLLDKLFALAERPFAIVLLHHENRAGQVSGAWERVPDTLIHVSAQGNGRTRVFWQKARWSSAMHGTITHLLWADGESYTVERKPEVTEDTMVDDLLAAALANPGASWTKIRDSHDVRGKATDLAKVRDRLIADGRLVNSAAREGSFTLWHSFDPASPRSLLGTARERLSDAPPAGTVGAEPQGDPFPVPAIEGNGRNGNGPTAPEADHSEHDGELAWK